MDIYIITCELHALTTGGTLSRGLNRTIATLVAGFLAIAAHMAANLCGEKGEPILLGVFVFLVGTYTYDSAGPSMFTTVNTNGKQCCCYFNFQLFFLLLIARRSSTAPPVRVWIRFSCYFFSFGM